MNAEVLGADRLGVPLKVLIISEDVDDAGLFVQNALGEWSRVATALHTGRQYGHPSVCVRHQPLLPIAQLILLAWTALPVLNTVALAQLVDFVELFFCFTALIRC